MGTNPRYFVEPMMNCSPCSRPRGPSFSLVVRAYSKTMHELIDVLFPSYLLFWDVQLLPTNWTIILDQDENINNSRLSNDSKWLMQHRIHPRVAFETLPANSSYMFPGYMRNPGYDRQQWSYFYSDMHCINGTEVVAFIDSDAMFITPVVFQDLFDEEGRPRMIGAGSDYVYFNHYLNGTLVALNLTPPDHFMMNFPYMVKRKHFLEFRLYVQSIHRMHFDQAFGFIVRHPRLWKGHYSQFDWMATYLWHFHRAEYAWHIEFKNSSTLDMVTMPSPAGEPGGTIVFASSVNNPIARVTTHLSKLQMKKSIRRMGEEGMCHAALHGRNCSGKIDPLDPHHKLSCYPMFFRFAKHHTKLMWFEEESHEWGRNESAIAHHYHNFKSSCHRLAVSLQ